MSKDSVFLIATTFLLFWFGGDPDLCDAVIHFLMK